MTRRVMSSATVPVANKWLVSTAHEPSITLTTTYHPAPHITHPGPLILSLLPRQIRFLLFSLGRCKSTKNVFAKWQDLNREAVLVSKAVERPDKMELIASSDDVLPKGPGLIAICSSTTPRHAKRHRLVHDSHGYEVLCDNMTYDIRREEPDSDVEVTLTFGRFRDGEARTPACPST